MSLPPRGKQCGAPSRQDRGLGREDYGRSSGLVRPAG